MTIPAGPLRENVKNLKNYDHVFLNGNMENLDEIKNKILSINSEINIHLGKYEIVNVNEFKKEDNYLVFSGIGNHSTFITMIKRYGFNIKRDGKWLIAPEDQSVWESLPTESEFYLLPIMSKKYLKKIGVLN